MRARWSGVGRELVASGVAFFAWVVVVGCSACDGTAGREGLDAAISPSGITPPGGTPRVDARVSDARVVDVPPSLRADAVNRPDVSPGTAAIVARASSPEGIPGLFSGSSMIRSFRPCGLDESWWPIGLDVYEHYKAAGAQDLVPVFVRLRGDVSAPGNYGHFNSFQREITVNTLLELRGQRADDCQ